MLLLRIFDTKPRNGVSMNRAPTTKRSQILSNLKPTPSMVLHVYMVPTTSGDMYDIAMNVVAMATRISPRMFHGRENHEDFLCGNGLAIPGCLFSI